MRWSAAGYSGKGESFALTNPLPLSIVQDVRHANVWHSPKTVPEDIAVLVYVYG
jgi:hypothetical protein